VEEESERKNSSIRVDQKIKSPTQTRVHMVSRVAFGSGPPSKRGGSEKMLALLTIVARVRSRTFRSITDLLLAQTSGHFQGVTGPSEKLSASSSSDQKAHHPAAPLPRHTHNDSCVVLGFWRLEVRGLQEHKACPALLIERGEGGRRKEKSRSGGAVPLSSPISATTPQHHTSSPHFSTCVGSGLHSVLPELHPGHG